MLKGGESVGKSTIAIDEAIAFFMFEQKLTVEKMASLLNMAPNTLRAKRSGERPWTWNEVMQLADITGKSLDELAGL